MPPRLYVGPIPTPSVHATLDLPDMAVRHAQVLRLQPGSPLRVFDGQGNEWQCRVHAMGRQSVQVVLEQALDRQAELPVHVTLAVVMPTNDRMDALVEKATELGAAVIQPLQAARSVLRLQGQRADKRVAHWQGVAVAASEQCGRNVVPHIHPIRDLSDWLRDPAATLEPARGLLSLHASQGVRAWAQARVVGGANASRPSCVLLSGPEGGLSGEEEAQVRSSGWDAVGLGPRVLRADTAPLAALSVLAAVYESIASPSCAEAGGASMDEADD